MNRSEQIADLAKALSVAQSQIQPPGKHETANVGAYKYRYADLAGCWDAIRKPLSDNGLSVVQLPTTNGNEVTVESTLFHESGQWISNSLTLHCAKPDAQGVGSAITYARRYSLMAITGIAPEDDDGQKAMPRTEREAEALAAKVGAVTASKFVGHPDEDFVRQVRTVAEGHASVKTLDEYGLLIKASYEDIDAGISEATYMAARAVLIARRKELLAAEVKENALAEQEV